MIGVLPAGVSPDPAEVEGAEDARREHTKARLRGERLERITDAVVRQLIANGAMPASSGDDARLALFSNLADELYGNAAIDVPTFRGGRR